MKKSIKIFVEDITPRWGTERAVVNLVNNLCKHGYQINIVSLYSRSGNPAFPTSPEINIKHCNIYRNKKGDSLIKRIGRFINLRRAILKNISLDDDIIIGTEIVINSLLGSIKIMQKNLKYINVIGWEHMVYDFPNPVAKKLRSLFYKYLDKIVLLTYKDEENYKEVGYKNTIVIYNEAPIIENIRKIPKNYQLLAVGRLTNMKGFDLLIEDMAPLLKDFPEWKLDIYGEGEMKPHLLKLIEKHEMENNIRIKPPSKNIFDIYQTTDIFLMSSRFESFGIVLVEAQASGLPIVAYNSQGPGEIIEHGIDGFLIPAGCPEDFRQAVKNLMTDDLLREQMSTHATRAAEKFHPTKIFTEWKRIIERV